MARVIRKRILIVEDDELFQSAITNFLKQKYDVSTARSGEEALVSLTRESHLPDLILLDIRLPGIDGIEVLEKIKERWPDLPVIMLTALSLIPQVVRAIKLGASDYLTKPITSEELFLTIARALESAEIKKELNQRRRLQLAMNKNYRLIGTSGALNRVREEIEVLAGSDVPVLIQGETGTGKELIARAIHGSSPRAGSPFVAINCGGIPRELAESELFGHKKGAFTDARTSEIGKFELANRGTLLLDEVAELPLDTQAKLLRVVENQEFYPVGSTQLVKVDVRIIAVSNRNLKERVEQGLFREDLFFRLNTYSLFVPPLREHAEDIPTLATYFMREWNIKFGKDFRAISPEAEKLLLTYSWPGNVRELRSAIERVVLFEQGPVIRREHLHFLGSPQGVRLSERSRKLPEDGIDAELRKVEKQLLLEALAQARWNKTKAAELLRLSLPSLNYRLEKHGIT